jgi:hypothetical protein
MAEELTPLEATLKAIQSLLSATGYLRGGVSIGSQPMRKPVDWSALVFLGSADVEELDLQSPIEIRTVQVEVWARLNIDNEQVELKMARLYDQFRGRFAGDFNLSSYGNNEISTGVREVDQFQMGADYEDRLFDNQEYRVMLFRVPLRVQDSSTFVK